MLNAHALHQECDRLACAITRLSGNRAPIKPCACRPSSWRCLCMTPVKSCSSSGVRVRAVMGAKEFLETARVGRTDPALEMREDTKDSFPHKPSDAFDMHRLSPNATTIAACNPPHKWGGLGGCWSVTGLCRGLLLPIGARLLPQTASHLTPIGTCWRTG